MFPGFGHHPYDVRPISASASGMRTGRGDSGTDTHKQPYVIPDRGL